MKTMKVTIRSHYGTRRVYPACKLSRTIAEIAGTKTLSGANIDQAKALGIGYQILPETFDLGGIKL